jgi:hypothetical protein
MLSIAFGQSQITLTIFRKISKEGSAKTKTGLWPQMAPLGYLNDTKTKQIYIDKEKAPLITKALSFTPRKKHT